MPKLPARIRRVHILPLWPGARCLVAGVTGIRRNLIRPILSLMGALRRHVSELSMHGRLTGSAVYGHCSSITRFIPNALVARPNLSEWSAKVILTMDPANIGPSCTPANYRGFNGIFSHARRLTRTVLPGRDNAEPYLAKGLPASGWFNMAPCIWLR